MSGAASRGAEGPGRTGGGDPLREAVAALADVFDDPGARSTFGRGVFFGTLAGAALVGTLLRARSRRRRRPRLVRRVDAPPGPSSVDPTSPAPLGDDDTAASPTPDRAPR